MKPMYYRLEPEVAGEWGEGTRVEEPRRHPPKVLKLDYEFGAWLGDGLLESFPCFIVTEDNAERLDRLGATGYTLREVEVSKSDEFEELYPGRELPPFRWLDVHGAPGRDDFGLESDARLVVSTAALEALRRGGLEHCEIEEYTTAAKS